MSSAQLLARADTSVSAHLVIARSGQILQLLPFNVKAWHAGYSSLEGRQNVNNFSIGIELDNAGPLHRRGQGWFTWFNKQIMPDEVFTKGTCILLAFLPVGADRGIGGSVSGIETELPDPVYRGPFRYYLS